MSAQPLSPETLQLVLAVHAGALDLDGIGDSTLRERVRVLREELLQSADMEAEDHLPAWLLAGWPAMEGSLSPLEREAIRSHLAQCDECRAELSILVGIREERSRAAARPSRSRGLLLTVAWASLATAASLVLWLRMPATGPAPEGSTVSIVLPATLRGQQDLVQVEVPEGTTRILLDLAQVFPTARRREISEAGTERVLILAEGPEGASALVAGEQSIESFSQSPSFELKNAPGEALAAGPYRCSAWLLQGDSGSATAGFSFQLAFAPAD